MDLITSYSRIEGFWTELIAQRPGRRWRVVTGRDIDLLMRDAAAHVMVRDALHGRGDVDYEFAHAWQPEPLGGGELEARTDVLFLGRPKPYVASRLSGLGRELERSLIGKFEDLMDGRPGDTIRYPGKRYTRRMLDEYPEGRRRFSRDYGVVAIRTLGAGPNARTVVLVGGLGMLGTYGMTAILVNARQRARLREQVQALAPFKLSYQPNRWLELCVRIEVDNERELSSMLNLMERKGDELPFRFETEVMALPDRNDETKIFFRMPEVRGLELRLEAGRKRSGRLRIGDSGGEIELSPKRYVLLSELKKSAAGCTPDELIDEIARHDPAWAGGTKQRQLNNLSRLICGFNKTVSKWTGRTGSEARLVKFENDRYRIDEEETLGGP